MVRFSMTPCLHLSLSPCLPGGRDKSALFARTSLASHEGQSHPLPSPHHSKTAYPKNRKLPRLFQKPDLRKGSVVGGNGVNDAEGTRLPISTPFPPTIP